MTFCKYCWPTVNQLVDFNWICTDVTFGHIEELIRFWRPWPNLPNLSQKVLVCTISHELVGRFQPHLHGYYIRACWRADLFLVTYFSRSLRDYNCQIWAKRSLCAQYLMNHLADFNQICMDITFGHDKSWIGFGDLDLIFKVTARHNLPKLSLKVFVCMLSHGLLNGMLPNLQACINPTGSIAY